jgi:hypothetical protein
MWKTSKIISLIRECTHQFLFRLRYIRDRLADHNRSEILWIDLPNPDPWKYNSEKHVFISVSQDGFRWQFTAATEQVRDSYLVFASFPIHHFTPRAFQEIDLRFVFSRSERYVEMESHLVDICQMNSEKIFSVLGYWWCIFDLVVMLKISFITMIEFTYSTGRPQLIMSSQKSWKRPFFRSYPVPGEPSEHWIAI